MRCRNCGYELPLGSLVCKKCSTRLPKIEVSPATKQKIEDIKRIDLHNSTRILSWDYIHNHTKEFGDISIKLEHKVRNFNGEVFSLLSASSEEELPYVVEVIYPYVLNEAIKFVQRAENLVGDIYEFKKAYDLGYKLVQYNKLDAEKFLTQMLNLDQPFKVGCAFIAQLSSRMVEILDPVIINQEIRYRTMNKHLARIFNQFLEKFVDRYIRYHMHPGVDLLESFWERYAVILKGLTSKEIYELDEEGWHTALNDWAKKHNGTDYKRKFTERRQAFLQDKENYEKECIANEYWKNHPEEHKKALQGKERIKQLESKIESIKSKQDILWDVRNTLKDQLPQYDRKVAENESEIERLKKKIFGKKKAATRITTLEAEINSLFEEKKLVQKKLSRNSDERNELGGEIINYELEIKKIKESIESFLPH